MCLDPLLADVRSANFIILNNHLASVKRYLPPVASFLCLLDLRE